MPRTNGGSGTPAESASRKGFDQSMSFDLVAIEEGSAVPKLLWNREIAQESLPGFSDELDDIVELLPVPWTRS